MKKYLEPDFKSIVGKQAAVFDDQNFKLHVDVVHGNYLAEVEKTAQVSIGCDRL